MKKKYKICIPLVLTLLLIAGAGWLWLRNGAGFPEGQKNSSEAASSMEVSTEVPTESETEPPEPTKAPVTEYSGFVRPSFDFDTESGEVLKTDQNETQGPQPGQTQDAHGSREDDLPPQTDPDDDLPPQSDPDDDLPPQNDPKETYQAPQTLPPQTDPPGTDLPPQTDPPETVLPPQTDPPETDIPPSTTALQPGLTVTESGQYSDKDHVALYIHLYGHLPSNYITKKQAEALGWKAGKNLWNYAPGKSIGGDVFHNYEGYLPSGHTYYECDIDYNGTKTRNGKRIVYSYDGLIFYTDDHYESFVQLYP